MTNFLTGKLAKRQIKKKNPKISLSKIIPQKTRATITHKSINGDKVDDSCENGLRVINKPENPSVKKIIKKIEPRNKFKIETVNKRIENKEKLRHNKTNRKGNHLCQFIENVNNDNKDRKVKLRQKSSKKVETRKKTIKNKMISNEKLKHTQKTNNCNRKIKNKIPHDPLLSRFEKITGSIKERCKMLSKKVEDLLSFKKKRKQKIVINETVQYSNIIKDNKNVSVRKKVEEIILHDYVPLPPRFSPCSFDNRVWDGLKNKPCKSSYDLVKTILKTQQTIDRVADSVTQERISSSIKINDFSPSRSRDGDHCAEIPLFPRLTYDSHINRLVRFNIRETAGNNINKHFITSQSKDNFVIPSITQNTRKIYKTKVRKIIDMKHKNLNEKKRSICDVQHIWDFQQESATIDCSTESNNNLFRNCEQNFAKANKEYFLNGREDSDHPLTYTFKELNCHVPLPHKYKNVDETYTFDTLPITPNDYNHQMHAGSPEKFDKNYTRRSNSDTIQHSKTPINTMNNVNIVFVSESQKCSIQHTSEINVEPLEFCEIVHSPDVEVNEPSIRQNNDSLFNDEFYVNSSLLDKDVFISASRNFSEDIIGGNQNAVQHCYNQQTVDEVITMCDKEKKINIKNTTNPLPTYNSNRMDDDNFNIRNRLRFVPKGNECNLEPTPGV